MKYARYILAVAIIGAMIFIFTKNDAAGPYISIAGFTQGTTYHITYQSPGTDTVELQDEIDQLLSEFDQSLSTYIDTSNISRINRNETDRIDAYFEAVFNEAKRVNELTGGAFDITVGPLIDAWGFGPGMKMEMSDLIIDSLMQFVGMDKVNIEDGKISKTLPGIRLDVNAIAQGYAVDVVASFLDRQRVKNYMVEIGGELTTKGLSPRGDLWRVGIDKPEFGNMMPGQDMQEVVSLSGQSLASSGNYRKYYEIDGKKIVHTIDPATGYTKMSNLLSVTIITEDCITADALATSCMVLGLEGSKKLLDSIDGVEALLIYTDEDGLYLEWSTSGMDEMLN